MAVVKGYAVTKHSAVVFMLLFTVLLALCTCGRKETQFDRYIFGHVDNRTGADFRGYKKEVRELYGAVDRNHTGVVSANSLMKPDSICIWDTADGGMAAFDYATGTYVYTRKAVSYDSLALILKNYIKNNRETE